MIEVYPKEHIVTHLVKFEDLNHHKTLFAGRCAEWMVEACFIAAAKLIGKPEDVVCVNVHDILFQKPAQKGDIVEFKSQVVSLGNKSLTVYAGVYNNSEETFAECYATFVTINGEGVPYIHGYSLSPLFIEEKKEIHKKALAYKHKK